MKSLINQNRFIKGVEYVSENFFSKPYSITPIVDRWFNQLAMIELADGQKIHLSGKVALDHVDITLDGMVVDHKDIMLILKHKGQNSEVKNEREDLIKSIDLLAQQLANDPQLEEQQVAFLTQKEKLATLDADKIKADKLYDEIVARGQSSLNEKSFETAYNSKIKNIVYRPNHGLTHSVRAAYLITSLYSYAKEHGVESKNLDEAALEKLQMMMLFSVVGRRDETGFNDGAQGRSTYEEFRVTSGKEYLKYSEKNSEHLYGNNLDNLYRDAIVVELMGYSSINDVLNRRRKPPEVFIDYIIAKERSLGREIQKDDALNLIATKKYSIDKLYPEGDIRKSADSKLYMMNQSHALDLTRCYSLYATKEGGSKSIGILNDHLNQADFYESPTIEKLTSFFKLMRCEFDILALTGQKSTFGFVSAEVFETNKAEIFKQIEETLNRFRNSTRTERLEDAKKNIKEIESIYGKRERTDYQLLRDHQSYAILTVIANHLTAAPKLKSEKALFEFHHSTEGNPHRVDHHKNALSLVNGLKSVTPITEFEPTPLAVISAVKHDLKAEKVTVFFSDRRQAELFKDTYSVMFGIKTGINTSGDGQFNLVVDRKNYKQLVKDQLVEFKQVEIPVALSRENSLVEDNGSIDALNLVARSRALGRLVSTSALNGETFPDYDYLLRSFEDPVHERFKPAIREIANFPVTHGKYYDPRSGECYIRTKAESPAPDIRFQEPITEPVKLSDKIADGWTTGKSGDAKNTIYTKKLAHTLLPPHGKMVPFEGYPGKKSNYFAIGVLSDISQVDLKDERYVWAQNMDTVTKFWKRDTSHYNSGIYKFLNAKLDEKGNPQRYPSSKSNPFPIIPLNKDGIKSPSSPEILIDYLEQRATDFLKRIDAKLYRPADSIIRDFKTLLRQERWEYLQQVSDNKPAQKRIKQIYSALEERLNQEEARKHPKYAITVRELIEQQKKTQDVGRHNEILASNTKGATRALYASKDTLVDRLNLAFHAMEIKKQYQYDVPLLIMSQDKSPYYYNEALIKADLQAAYELLKTGKFPYDKTLYKVFEVDSEGKVALNSKGKRIVKKNERDHVVQEPKNLSYQKELLVNLFKLGFPDLKSVDQLRREKMGAVSLDRATLDSAIASIIDKMDLVGGLKRETQLMNEVFAQDDIAKKEKFFLRCASLGHQSLIESILARDDFKLTGLLVDKAIQFADKNQHDALKVKLIELPYNDEKRALKATLSELKKPINADENAFKAYEVRLETINEVKRRYAVLNSKFDVSDLNMSIQQQVVNTYLNSASRSEKNEKYLPEFIKLLGENPQYADQYTSILAANEMVKLDQLIDAHERHGVDYVTKAMSKIATDGWQAANDYLVLVELNILDKAEEYRNSAGSISTVTLDLLSEECMNYIKQIRTQAWGSNDTETQDYCEAMADAVNNSKGNFVALNYNLQKLKETHQAVYSPEMMAIKDQVQRFEQNAQSFFGMGNQKKANRIINAASHVPLNDRAFIFSNEENPACNEVRKALASHRISFSDPVTDGKVNLNNAATSYKEVQRIVNINNGFKERYKSSVDNEASDFTNEPYNNSPK